MHPPSLYDTELAGRLADSTGSTWRDGAADAGPGTGQGTRGRGLVKRPLPPAWLNYAALDVECCSNQLRRVSRSCSRTGQNRLGRTLGFQFVPHFRGHPDASGPVATHLRRHHKVHNWRAGWRCVNCGTPATTSPSAATSRQAGSCPDSAIIDAARADPKTVEEILALPVFGRLSAAAQHKIWLVRLAAAGLTDPPHASELQNGPPRPCAGAGANPRRPRARGRAHALSEVSEIVHVPHREPGVTGTGPAPVLGLGADNPTAPRR